MPADFSLYWGRWDRRAIVVRHVKIQHSSACCGTVDWANMFDLLGSMPQASNEATICSTLWRNTFGFFHEIYTKNQILVWKGIGLIEQRIHLRTAMSSNANRQWKMRHRSQHFVVQPSVELHRNNCPNVAHRSVGRRTELFVDTAAWANWIRGNTVLAVLPCIFLIHKSPAFLN